MEELRKAVINEIRAAIKKLNDEGIACFFDESTLTIDNSSFIIHNS